MRQKLERALLILALIAATLAQPAIIRAGTNAGQPCNPTCLAQDNGSGTVDLPAACDYTGNGQMMHIIDGLPAGTQIDIEPVLSSYFSIVRTPGGSLGGEVLQFGALLKMQLTGTGMLTGYSRVLTMNNTIEIDNAPHGSGTPQSFAGDLQHLQGQLPAGDPDFDLLRITAGTGFGMPSPGHTTLTKQSGTNWDVESFFDITYRIDFIGHPGGPMGGMSGSTTGTIRMTQGHHFWTVADGSKMHFPQLPDPAGWDVYGVTPLVLGDDWQCSQTGFVKDLHFWGSWLNDINGPISSFDISIRADVPATPVSPSYPGAILWQRNITNFCELPFTPTTLEGWYEPSTQLVIPNNHLHYYQYDVTLDSPDWFSQTQGTIYWLCISANVVDPLTRWGWKSTQNHFNDDASWQQPGQPICPAPDNGTGTIDLPASCSYDNTVGTYDIINGLPPGSEVNSQGKLMNFFNVIRTPGGPLGGELDDFQASLLLQMTGTGALSGFSKNVMIPIGGSNSAQMAHGPRVPGSPLQDFPSDMFRLFGQLPPGDPDFDLLRISGGTDFGMPSPGHTTLTMVSGGTWNVDSFFDLTYRIDFVGHSGGPFGGMSGSTTGTIRIQQGGPLPPGGWIDLHEPPTFGPSMDLAFVITDGSTVAPCNCMPGDANGDAAHDISDAVYLISYIFGGGPAPTPYAVCSGDANCDCAIDISDAVYMISYIFAGGPAPCDCAQWSASCGPPMK